MSGKRARAIRKFATTVFIPRMRIAIMKKSYRRDRSGSIRLLPNTARAIIQDIKKLYREHVRIALR